MKIINKSIEIGPIKELTDNHYLFNYSEVYQGDNMDVIIEVDDEDGNITELKANSSCGCTDPEVKLNEDGKIELKIKYNSNLLGVVLQKVTVLYKANGTQKIFKVDIEGNVLIKK